MTEHITLQHRWALGDTVLLTGLVRDLSLAYPGRFTVAVETNYPAVWQNNPYIAARTPGTRKVKLSWRQAAKTGAAVTIAGSRRLQHILAWYHYDFTRQTGITVPVLYPRPDLHIGPVEQLQRRPGRYWVMFAGGKLDITNKHWATAKYQAVADRLTQQGITVLQCGAAGSHHQHALLRNVEDWRGRTEDVRELFSLISHADGVICPVTGPMHVAAALERPCVVIAGGREEPWFEAYTAQFDAFGPNCPVPAVPHRFLHTFGRFPCCRARSCWARKTLPVFTRQGCRPPANDLCRRPVQVQDGQTIAACMDAISADEAADAALSYYRDGTLPALN